MADPVDPDIIADDKSWTWVLERVCGECGFDVRAFEPSELGAMVRANATEWADLLDGPAAEVCRRPEPGRWSTLEYACHVRDVFRVYDARLERMLTEDGPHYENWDQDATAVQERYGEQDPAVVGAELQAAAGSIADRFDTVRGEQWGRPGFRGDGEEFTIESFGRYFIHDPVHHLHDVESARLARERR